MLKLIKFICLRCFIFLTPSGQEEEEEEEEEEEIKLKMKQDRTYTYNVILKWRFTYFICEINEWGGHGFAPMATSVYSRQ
jgi:hypothetical protein